MEKTIEERAITVYPNWTSGGISITQNKREGYVRGATEQKQIDIEKFLSLLDKALEEWNEPHRPQLYIIDKEGALRKFRKAMED